MTTKSDLSRALPALRASDDDADRVAYARDLWPGHHLAVRAGQVGEHRPGAIVWPESTDDVVKLVRWARESGTPLVPFGAGSGVCAGVLPSKEVVVVDLKRMARWRALDRDGPELEVESGHMGVPLEEELNRQGFTLGHFPSSILCSSVGGWVAARSAGQCSGYYGKIEDMVTGLEVVTGAGDLVRLGRRTSEADLVPLLVGSEGTMGVITSATLRLHPAPTARAFAAWSFPTTEAGWEAMREMFQSGLRPAVARLYDPFDAMLARAGGVRKRGPKGEPSKKKAGGAPGLGAAALRGILRRPMQMNELLHSGLGGRLLGGALLVVIFEGQGEVPHEGAARARALAESLGGKDEGEGPARKWLEHRYAVSYRQAPIFAAGAFVDTMEVAAPWSRLGALYEGVRRALGDHVFVMAHFSHAYPDGCCIYFSFAGSAAKDQKAEDWDAACQVSYDRAWRAALGAAEAAGGTIAHHHGVGRSKAPRLRAELGGGIDVVRALLRATDPGGIMNPGNLLPPPSPLPAPWMAEDPTGTQASGPSADEGIVVDEPSLLVSAPGRASLEEVERVLSARGLTLDLAPGTALGKRVGDWLASGAEGARDPWLDPADHLVAGLGVTVSGERSFAVRPAPRSATGPDLRALFVGARGRFGRIDWACLRVHRRGVVRPATAPFAGARDRELSEGERSLLGAMSRALLA